ncbi:hypothetical protein F4814DRAFT_431589 [Daldinia grandis]|nr:hypothetical protein F4814DRAFT_431589 [Daldinia grandis]
MQRSTWDLSFTHMYLGRYITFCMEMLLCRYICMYASLITKITYIHPMLNLQHLYVSIGSSLDMHLLTLSIQINLVGSLCSILATRERLDFVFMSLCNYQDYLAELR